MEPGVNKLVRAAYDILNLQSFFTVGKTENRAWTIKKGMTAPQAAGIIHSDLERGFIRAEVITYDELVHYGSEHAVKEAGKFRVEGKIIRYRMVIFLISVLMFSILSAELNNFYYENLS